jgi:hypothetical protein
VKPFQRWTVWIGSAVVGATGIVYWWMDRMMEPVSEWAVISHPLQPWVLKAHIITAPLLVFAFGLIAVEHVWKHYRGRIRRGRRSGLSTLWLFGPMVVSGYLIQAVTHPGWLAVVAWLHIGTGAAYLAGIAIHQVAVGRRRRRSRGVADRSGRAAEGAAWLGRS